MTRSLWLLLAAALVAMSAVLARRVLDATRSPYQFGSTRAGMSFATMDAAAYREMHRRFTCRTMSGAVRRCEIATDGPPGAMSVLVDASGHAAILRVVVRDTTLRMREGVRQLAAEWNLVSAGVADAGEGGRVIRWASADGRWLADLNRRDSADAPTRATVVVTLTDLRRLGAIGNANALVVHLLAKEGLVEDRVLERLPSDGRLALGRVLDSLANEARAHAKTARALPDCPRVATTTVEGGSSMRESAGAYSVAREQAMARIAPGSRLVYGDDRIFLVDADGLAEEVRLYPNGNNLHGDRYAFVLSYPERLRTARTVLQPADAPGRCRPRTEIVLATLDAGRAVVAIQRVEVDDESLASEVQGLEFISADEGAQALMATYVGIYGTTEWTGRVQWRQLLTAEPLEVVQRIPDIWGRTERDGTDAAGTLARPNDYGDGPYWFAPKGATLELVSYESGEPRSRQRHVTVPPGNAGLMSGWVLLGRM